MNDDDIEKLEAVLGVAKEVIPSPQAMEAFALCAEVFSRMKEKEKTKKLDRHGTIREEKPATGRRAAIEHTRRINKDG